MAEGIEELGQLVYLALEDLALVGVAHADALRRLLDHLGGAHDVSAAAYGLLLGDERLVLDELEVAAVVDQRIARDTGGLVVSLGKASVDHHQFTVGTDRTLALLRAHRDVAVDDVTLRALHAKLIEDHVADFLVLAQGVVMALLLAVSFGIFDEIAFEGGHLALVEQGRVGPAPQIPIIVARVVLLLGGCIVVEGRAQQHPDLVEQLASAILAAIDRHVLQRAVGIERHGGVEEEVGIVDAIHAAVAEEAGYVAFEPRADGEGVVELGHQLLFLGGEGVGVGGVDGGEVGVGHRIDLAVDLHSALRVVDAVEQPAVVHGPFGVFLRHGTFELELDYGDGLVHLSHQAEGLFGVLRLLGIHFGGELRAGIVGVGLHCHRGEGEEVDPVAVLKGREVGVAERDAHDVGYAAVVAGGRAHPEHVVVAPLDVPVAVVTEGVHDQVCTRTAVIDVAEDMELVDAQLLDHVAHGYNEGVGLTGGDDGLDDAVEVGLLVILAALLVEQLLYNIGELLGECLADFRAGVFRRYALTHLDELMEGDVVEILHVLLGGAYDLHLLFGIVDEGAELADLVLAHGSPVDVGHFTLDVARRVLEYVAEGFVLAVEVGHEMLRPLGEVEDGFKIYDLGACRAYVGKRLGEEFEDSAVVFGLLCRDLGIYG